MKIITVLALYVLFLINAKDKNELWIFVPMLALSLALAMGLEVPYISDVAERIMGGVS